LILGEEKNIQKLAMGPQGFQEIGSFYKISPLHIYPAS